jgi:putative flippase GtrA
MYKSILRLFTQYRQPILYGIIGLTGAILDLLLYIIFYRKLGIPPVAASIMSVSIGILNNFYFNVRFNFKVHDKLFVRFLNFYSVGFAGVMVSTLLIVLLYNIAHIDPVIAKILTIIPVVFMQYVLNKRFSFKRTDDATNTVSHPLTKLLTHHYWLIVISLVFLGISLIFVNNLGLNSPPYAPDEGTHYNYNVLYIIQHKSLPISGRDDIFLLNYCRDTHWGIVPCTYSYEAYPGANYVVTAIGAIGFHHVFNLSYILGARLIAVFWGLTALWLIYFMALRITNNRNVSAVISASICLIPQVIFTSSYVNQDAHSLAIGAFVGYALVRLLQDKDTRSLCIAGLAFGGALPLAKLNYMLLYLPLLVVLLVVLKRKIVTKQLLMKLIGWSILGFLLIAGFWYARNIMLYHDPFGQSFTLRAMSKYHSLGHAKSMTWLTFQQATQIGFFDTIFRSFYLAFGALTDYMAPATYSIIQFGLFGTIFASFVIASQLKPSVSKQAMLAIAGLLVIIAAAIALVYQNAIVYDFQPQGRYLFSILTPLALVLAYLYKLDPRFKYIAFSFLCITLYALLNGFDVIIRKVLVV